MNFSENKEMIQTLPANGGDPAFGIRVDENNGVNILAIDEITRFFILRILSCTT
jgi:hypothetical protein